MEYEEMLPILSAFQYDKVQFDADEKSLYSNDLPIILYMGRYRSSHLATKFIIPQGGFHHLFCSSDESKLRVLIRNFHISSHLNGKAVPILFTGEKDSNGKFGYSCFAIHAGENRIEIIHDVDVIYDMCLENAARNEAEKQLLIVFVVGLSQIDLFSDILLYGKHIDRSLLQESQSNAFDVIYNASQDASPNASNTEHQNKITAIPVESKMVEMLNKGSEYGITFIFGEKSETNISPLSQFPIKVFNIDEVAATDLITRRGIVDSIIPWKSSPSDEVLEFLCKESPQYRAQWEYAHVAF